MIRHEGDKWILYTQDGSKVLGTHDTEVNAQKQEAAVGAAKHRGAEQVEQSELRHLRGETGVLRVEQYEGREHLVVPVVALMEGVIHAVNAPGAEFVPLASLARAPQGWDGRPVVLRHPAVNGRQVSANDPTVLASHAFGRVFKSRLEGTKLLCEAWIDPQRLEALGASDVLKRLRAGEVLEVSVGAFVTTDAVAGNHGGKPYQSSWKDIVPDHLAFLPDTKGACSVAMGCGAPRTAEGDNMEPRSLTDRLLALFSFRGAAASQCDLAEALTEALCAVTPGFLCVQNVYLDDTVVYAVGSPNLAQGPEDMKLFKRSFMKDEDGKVALADDAAEVEAVTTYEPKMAGIALKIAAGRRNNAADQATVQQMHDHSVTLGAECSAQNLKVLAAQTDQSFDERSSAVQSAVQKKWGASSTLVESVATEPVTTLKAAQAAQPQPCGCTIEGVTPMTAEQKTATIASLVACKHSGFTPDDQAMLEGASDARLESFVVAAEARKQEVAAAAAKEPKALSEEEFMKIAPPALRTLISRQQRQETELKATLVAELKAAQEEYSEAELAAMPIEALERFARMAHVEAKPDYAGRGVPRHLAKGEDVFANPPDPYAEALKRRAAQQAH